MEIVGIPGKRHQRPIERLPKIVPVNWNHAACSNCCDNLAPVFVAIVVALSTELSYAQKDNVCLTTFEAILNEPRTALDQYLSCAMSNEKRVAASLFVARPIGRRFQRRFYLTFWSKNTGDMI